MRLRPATHPAGRNPPGKGALPQAPDLHYTWDLLPTLTHSRTGWILSNHSENWPYEVTAVGGPGGTTVITGEMMVTAKRYN